MSQWTAPEQEERDSVVRVMRSARTLSEVERAKDALRAWLERHPDDDAIQYGGEILAHRADYARWRDAERQNLGFSEEAGWERERIFVQAERAGTIDEINQARADLLVWRWSHPCDAPSVDELLLHLDREETIELVIARELGNLPNQSAFAVGKGGDYADTSSEPLNGPTREKEAAEAVR